MLDDVLLVTCLQYRVLVTPPQLHAKAKYVDSLKKIKKKKKEDSFS